jgi:ribonucleotide reductase alpha subunit
MTQNFYTREQLEKEALSYFSGDQLAAKVWIDKYALQRNDESYEELTPDDTHKRLAREFARIEAKYENPLSEEEIYSYLKDFKYIVPQGSPMEGIGNNHRIQSLSNCFVVASPPDSYGGICHIDQEQVQLMKRRGGVGFDLSEIRPKGMHTNNAAKTTDGIAVFMERYSNTTREVAQNGRRGALMLSCFAPDTFVLTDNGWEYISKTIERWYKGEKPLAWTHEGMKKIIDVQEFENREIYEVECENGRTIKVTGDHKFVVKNIETNEEYLKKLIDIDVEKEVMVFYE